MFGQSHDKNLVNNNSKLPGKQNNCNFQILSWKIDIKEALMQMNDKMTSTKFFVIIKSCIILQKNVYYNYILSLAVSFNCIFSIYFHKISIWQLLLYLCYIKRSCIREFSNILKDTHYWNIKDVKSSKTLGYRIHMFNHNIYLIFI